MFDHVQNELNEILDLTRQTTMFEAGLALDPNGKREERAFSEQEQRRKRLLHLMVKYDLTENVVYPRVVG